MYTEEQRDIWWISPHTHNKALAVTSGSAIYLVMYFQAKRLSCSGLSAISGKYVLYSPNVDENELVHNNLQ